MILHLSLQLMISETRFDNWESSLTFWKFFEEEVKKDKNNNHNNNNIIKKKRNKMAARWLMAGFWAAELYPQSRFMPTINHGDIRLIFDISDSIKEVEREKEKKRGKSKEGNHVMVPAIKIDADVFDKSMVLWRHPLTSTPPPPPPPHPPPLSSPSLLLPLHQRNTSN